MQFSKHNIFSKIKDSDKYYIINILSGNADILNSIEAEELIKLKNNQEFNIDSELIANLIKKGYLADKDEEKILFQNKYLDFIDNREKDEIQLFFVLNYTCNFACSYCYQKDYRTDTNIKINDEVIHAFFKYISGKFAGRRKYITLFGGEPLLNNQKKYIDLILTLSYQAGIDVCIVTNGYNLIDYIDILKKVKIREIQVTLDGMPEVHNKRRYLKDGSKTFGRIVEGIDACLRENIPINLRMVVDKDNIGQIPLLADFAINKKWTKNKLFKTQIGRNYELHNCQLGREKLYDRIGLYEDIYKLIKQYPQVLEFYKPAFSVSKFLAENGILPEPLFDSCPACKTEWAFDYTGRIFPCTATVGKNDESLGKFYPEIIENNDIINEWERRDVISISECSDCEVQLACGGGCGSVAKNKNGNICSADCRPVKELIEYGMEIYFNNKINNIDYERNKC
jgi:uncharacterized protein